MVYVGMTENPKVQYSGDVDANVAARQQHRSVGILAILKVLARGPPRGSPACNAWGKLTNFQGYQYHHIIEDRPKSTMHKHHQIGETRPKMHERAIAMKNSTDLSTAAKYW